MDPQHAKALLEATADAKQAIQVGSSYQIDGNDVILMSIAAWQGKDINSENLHLYTDRFGNGRISESSQRNYTKAYPVGYVGGETYELIDEETKEHSLEKGRAMAVYRILGVMKDGAFLHHVITSDEFEADAIRKKLPSDSSVQGVEIKKPELTTEKALEMAKEKISGFNELKKAKALPGDVVEPKG